MTFLFELVGAEADTRGEASTEVSCGGVFEIRDLIGPLESVRNIPRTDSWKSFESAEPPTNIAFGTGEFTLLRHRQFEVVR